MNFDTAHPLNMPELRWRYGYLFALGVMVAISAMMLLIFWSRGWRGKRTDLGRDGDAGNEKTP